MDHNENNINEKAICPNCGRSDNQNCTLVWVHSTNKITRSLYECAKNKYKCENCGYVYYIESDKDNGFTIDLYDSEGRIIGLGL